jgi:hypothetical protein
MKDMRTIFLSLFALITGLTEQLECWISSANAKESEINSLEAFVKFIENF